METEIQRGWNFSWLKQEISQDLICGYVPKESLRYTEKMKGGKF